MKRRTRSRSLIVMPLQERSAIVRSYRLWTRCERCWHDGQAAVRRVAKSWRGDPLVGNGHIGKMQALEVRQERGKTHMVLQALATLVKQESIPSPVKNGLE